MKTKIKLTETYLAKLGIPADAIKQLFTDLPVEQLVVKRISVEQPATLEYPEDEDTRYVRGVISTVDVDADGDVVIQEGLDFTRFSGNPVVLFNHDLSNPVGYSDELRISPDRSVTMAKTYFGTTPEASKVYQLLKDRVLRTFSIGFIPMEAVEKGAVGFRTKLDELTRMYPERFTADKRESVDRIITKALVIEYSVVTVPANEHAVLHEIKKLNACAVTPPAPAAGVEPVATKQISITRVNTMEVKRLGTVEDLQAIATYKAYWGI